MCVPVSLRCCAWNTHQWATVLKIASLGGVRQIWGLLTKRQSAANYLNYLPCTSKVALYTFGGVNKDRVSCKLSPIHTGKVALGVLNLISAISGQCRLFLAHSKKPPSIFWVCQSWELCEQKSGAEVSFQITLPPPPPPTSITLHHTHPHNGWKNDYTVLS